LVAVGEKLPGVQTNLADARIKAAIAMSPPMPQSSLAQNYSFTDIHLPVFVMTGTEDAGFTKSADRRTAFDKISSRESCLVIFNGGDHMAFSGHVGFRGRDKDKQFQPFICEASLAFWDAHLRGDTNAAAWLAKDFKAKLGANGTFELKK
jgi:predicted dienelactone hydrolase